MSLALLTHITRALSIEDTLLELFTTQTFEYLLENSSVQINPVNLTFCLEFHRLLLFLPSRENSIYRPKYNYYLFALSKRFFTPEVIG